VAAALPNPGLFYAVAGPAHNMLCFEGVAPPRYGGSAIRDRGWEPSLPNTVPRVGQQPQRRPTSPTGSEGPVGGVG